MHAGPGPGSPYSSLVIASTIPPNGGKGAGDMRVLRVDINLSHLFGCAFKVRLSWKRRDDGATSMMIDRSITYLLGMFFLVGTLSSHAFSFNVYLAFAFFPHIGVVDLFFISHAC
jgi:hypothetical protein